MQLPQNHGMWRKETVNMCLDISAVPWKKHSAITHNIVSDNIFFSILSNGVTCISFGRFP